MPVPRKVVACVLYALAEQRHGALARNLRLETDARMGLRLVA